MNARECEVRITNRTAMMKRVKKKFKLINMPFNWLIVVISQRSTLAASLAQCGTLPPVKSALRGEPRLMSLDASLVS